MVDTSPETPPTEVEGLDRADTGDSLEKYHKVAETVGMLPSLRIKDHLFQAVVVAGLTIIGALVGWLLWGPSGAAGLAIGGLVLGTLLSGFVLMILGWMRASQGRES